ncbi:unnamed protein product [Rotaria magnacalcarata]|nr:unnamed protein product [Rotaria magnacalcarata]CAF3842102.1 unnamed protein product [Rotaria magnacalcarata]
MPPQQNPNPSGPPPMPMGVPEGMHSPNVPFFPPSGQHMMNQYPRYPNAPPRSLIRMPQQSDYPGGPGMPLQMDSGRNGMRMTSPGARMPSNPMGHPGPGGQLPNAYRPQIMSPSINQPGPRMHITNSPGVGYSSSSPVPYGTPCPTGHAPTTPTMMPSPQDPNNPEMQPYTMRNMPPGMGHGPNPMYHDPHLSHIPPDMTHHGDYDQQMKQSPNQQQQQQQQQSQPPDVTNYNYSEDPSNDTNAILKLKESMQEEVKKFDKTPNSSHNDDYNHFGSIG